MSQIRQHSGIALGILVSVGLWLSLQTTVYGSTSLDTLYRFKRMVPLVLNVKEHPVFAGHIEAQLYKILKKDPRFEIPDEAHDQGKFTLESISIKEELPVTANGLEPFKTLFETLAKMEIDGIVIAQLTKAPKQPHLKVLLVNPKTFEIIAHETQVVENGLKLDHYTATLTQVWHKIEERLPFDATVVKRSGFRVVIDRGLPDIIKGMRLPAFTFIPGKESTEMIETGVVQIDDSQENLSFGKIVLEHRPLEIAALNKLIIPETLEEQPPSLAEAAPGEALSTSSKRTPRKRTLGFIGIDIGAQMVSLSNSEIEGGDLNDTSILYPGGSLRTELWLTHSLFLEFGFRFGMGISELSSGQGSSSISDFRGQLGYRFHFDADTAKLEPSLFVKIGFGKQKFSIDPSEEDMAFMSTKYSGLLFGGGIDVPLTLNALVGFQFNTMRFTTFEEEPMTSGEVDGDSGWDLALRVLYRLNDAMDIEVRGLLQSVSAEFTGEGTRSEEIVSSSQTTKALLAGIHYYF